MKNPIKSAQLFSVTVLVAASPALPMSAAVAPAEDLKKITAFAGSFQGQVKNIIPYHERSYPAIK
jgi:hypothetical protein